jgi:hypothetical protein
MTTHVFIVFIFIHKYLRALHIRLESTAFGEPVELNTRATRVKQLRFPGCLLPRVVVVLRLPNLLL